MAIVAETFEMKHVALGEVGVPLVEDQLRSKENRCLQDIATTKEAGMYQAKTISIDDAVQQYSSSFGKKGDGEFQLFNRKAFPWGSAVKKEQQHVQLPEQDVYIQPPKGLHCTITYICP